MKLYSVKLINKIKNKVNNLAFVNNGENMNRGNMRLMKEQGVKPSNKIITCSNKGNMNLAEVIMRSNVNIKRYLRTLIGINVKISKFAEKYIFDKEKVDALNKFLGGAKESSTVLKEIEGYKIKFNKFLYEKMGEDGIENLKALIDVACSENNIVSKVYSSLKFMYSVDLNKIMDTINTGNKINKNILEYSENFDKQIKLSLNTLLRNAVNMHKWEFVSFIISRGGDKQVAIEVIEKELPIDEFGIIVKCGIMLPKEAALLMQRAIEYGGLKLNKKRGICKSEQVIKVNNNRGEIVKIESTAIKCELEFA